MFGKLPKRLLKPAPMPGLALLRRPVAASSFSKCGTDAEGAALAP